MPAKENRKKVDPDLVYHLAQDAVGFVDGLNIEMNMSQASLCLGLVLGGVSLGAQYAKSYSPRQISEAVRVVRASAVKAFDSVNRCKGRTAAKKKPV